MGQLRRAARIPSAGSRDGHRSKRSRLGAGIGNGASDYLCAFQVPSLYDFWDQFG